MNVTYDVSYHIWPLTSVQFDNFSSSSQIIPLDPYAECRSDSYSAGCLRFWQSVWLHWITSSFLPQHVPTTNFSTRQVWQSLLSQCNTTCLLLKWNQSWIHPSIKHFGDTLQSWVMESLTQDGLLHNFTPETWFLEIWDKKLNSKQLLLQPGLVNFCQQLKTKS